MGRRPKTKSLGEYRKERMMTVPDFVEFLGIKRDTYFRLQRGQVPRIRTVRQIAQRLGVQYYQIEEFAALPSNPDFAVTTYKHSSEHDQGAA